MVLLTGANGFLGRSVQRALTTRSVEFRPYEGDIRDFQRLRDELVDIRSVIHLAGAESPRPPTHAATG